MSTFVDLDTQEVEALRNQDPTIGAIHDATEKGAQLSFSWLRAAAGRDRALWGQLGRGRAILTSTVELDQYLYSYGPMIACQWEGFSDTFSFEEVPVRLVDYGCGQGLAGLLLFDKFGDQFSKILKKIVLVEPSPCALARAEAIYRSISPDSEIFCVNKGFDNLSLDDLKPEVGLETVHVFSNVLDIEHFDHDRLFDVLLSPGIHSILVVSSARDLLGGNKLILDRKAAVDELRSNDAFHVSDSASFRFNCGAGGKYDVIAWRAKVEVLND